MAVALQNEKEQQHQKKLDSFRFDVIKYFWESCLIHLVSLIN